MQTNDQMLIIYVSALIRAVIAIHNLINNKVGQNALGVELACPLCPCLDRPSLNRPQISLKESEKTDDTKDKEKEKQPAKKDEAASKEDDKKEPEAKKEDARKSEQ